MRYKEICGKEVVNIQNGEILGVVNDIGFDPYTYTIHCIYVKNSCGFVKRLLPFIFTCSEIQINVEEIANIHGDVILVQQ